MIALEKLQALLVDRYEIERELGAGGMATVYLARDLRHQRRVALKVLPPELGSVLGVERFLKEIEVTAQLQHPHLLPLFDSGEADGLLYYVMPYVAGETLRARLEREKQLPIGEAVRVATALASALDYAHRHGVVHRDLKPENILLHEGQPLIADFGIALAVSVAGGARMTETGWSLGTPQYMSPEQATGSRHIDARSDIYSLGAITYEMLVGEPPHTGANVQGIIAKVLIDRPHGLRSIRETIPPHVEAAVLGALAKLPADRFATAGEYAEALAGLRTVAKASIVGGAAGSPATEPGRRMSMRRVRGAALLGASAALAFLIGRSVTTPVAPPLVTPKLLEVTFADSVTLTGAGSTSLAVSRDGARVAFLATAGGVQGIFIREMDSGLVRRVRGTEGSSTLQGFSPDGEWLLFNRPGQQVLKVPIVGGTAIPTGVSRGGIPSWSDRGEIIFQHDNGLGRVSAEGGDPLPLAEPDAARGHDRYMWPFALPGGNAALIVIWKRTAEREDAILGVVDIPGGYVTELGISGSNPRFVRPGYLVFAGADGAVFAAPFSLRRLAITGPVIPVLDGVFMGTANPPGAAIAISNDGTLVWRSEAPERLVSIDRNGTPGPSALTSGRFPRVSPDGRRIVHTVPTGGGFGDVWVFDLVTATTTRLTTDGNNIAPEWSPDGRQIAYLASRSRGRAPTDATLLHQPWDGSGTAAIFDSSFPIYAVSTGPPGSYLAVLGPDNTIFIAPVDSPQALRPFVESAEFSYRQPRVSPDGRLLAYISNESGRYEVYIRPLPGPGGRIPVSNSGGTEPVWSADGKELYYRSATQMMAATIQQEPDLEVTRVAPLFPDPYIRSATYANYDVFPDGRGFVMVEAGASRRSLSVIVNWTELLRQRFESPQGRR